jgi:hypothetical protein
MTVLTKHPSSERKLPPVAAARSSPDWGAAGWAGIAGAALYLALEVGPLFFGGNPFQPLRMIAAIAFEILPNPAPSNGAILLAAMAIHLPLSLIYAHLLSLTIYRRKRLWTSVLIGAAFGFVLYLFNFYAVTRFFPWFILARSARAIVDHVLFGAFTAWTYKSLERPQPA